MDMTTPLDHAIANVGELPEAERERAAEMQRASRNAGGSAPLQPPSMAAPLDPAHLQAILHIPTSASFRRRLWLEAKNRVQGRTPWRGCRGRRPLHCAKRSWAQPAVSGLRKSP